MHQALAPALVDSIKTAGLVLVVEASDESPGAPALPPAIPSERIDGVFQSRGALRFSASVDM